MAWWKNEATKVFGGKRSPLYFSCECQMIPKSSSALLAGKSWKSFLASYIWTYTLSNETNIALDESFLWNHHA